MSAPIIGIDLGTTNSVVAILREGKPEVIPNSEGSKTTPSVVLFEPNGKVVVGELAKRQCIARPAETVRSIKSLMGRRYTEVKDRIANLSYTVTANEQDQLRVQMQDREYSPEEISAEILKKMKESAEAFLDEEVSQAVVTVPAYFNDSQRQATKRAGELAGLEVLRIINEPTAAALAYGLGKDANEHIAVFDFGGGTFDISILDLDQDVFEVRSTCGDTSLGGDDIDQLLYTHIRKEILDETGVDICNDRSAVQRVMEMAERVKCELSTLDATAISLPFVAADETGPKHYQSTIKREAFERMIGPVVQWLLRPCDQAIRDAKLTAADISTVLLVGGSTRIPAVRALARQFFNREPSTSINPDEAVALGAAIQAAVLTGNLQEVLLLDVTPLSLGIELQGGVFAPLIPRNASIPTAARKRFTTVRDEQTSVWVHVLQGERKIARENRTLGHFRLTGITPAPSEIPEIEVAFSIDANGILSVSAMDVTSGISQSINIESYLQAIDGDPERLIAEAERKAEEDRQFVRDTRMKVRFLRSLEMFSTFLERFQGRMDEQDIEQLKRGMLRLDIALSQNDFPKAEQADLELSEVCNRYSEFFMSHKVGYSA
jgi:molecular chaperone DnaK